MSDEASRDGERSLAEGAHTEFQDRFNYSDYLKLDVLLSAQSPLSDRHDELLFIVIHQVTELWMKLVIQELRDAIEGVRGDELAPVFKMLSRVSKVQSQLIQSWDVLSTMTPADYLTFRDRLGQASGFQSPQYRLIEFLLGNKNAAMIEPHRHRPEVAGRLERALCEPSLYDEAIRLLARRDFAIAAECVERDWRRAYAPHPSVTAAWLEVYNNTEQYWDLYELAEKLVDLEDWFQQWRFRHVTTVERIIGHKPGTGGTAGVPYLRKALDIRFFPELWEVRTAL